MIALTPSPCSRSVRFPLVGPTYLTEVKILQQVLGGTFLKHAVGI